MNHRQGGVDSEAKKRMEINGRESGRKWKIRLIYKKNADERSERRARIIRKREE